MTYYHLGAAQAPEVDPEFPDCPPCEPCPTSCPDPAHSWWRELATVTIQGVVSAIAIYVAMKYVKK